MCDLFLFSESLQRLFLKVFYNFTYIYMASFLSFLQEPLVILQSLVIIFYNLDTYPSPPLSQNTKLTEVQRDREPYIYFSEFCTSSSCSKRCFWLSTVFCVSGISTSLWPEQLLLQSIVNFHLLHKSRLSRGEVQQIRLSE